MFYMLFLSQAIQDTLGIKLFIPETRFLVCICNFYPEISFYTLYVYEKYAINLYKV